MSGVPGLQGWLAQAVVFVRIVAPLAHSNKSVHRLAGVGRRWVGARGLAVQVVIHNSASSPVLRRQQLPTHTTPFEDLATFSNDNLAQ